MNEVKQRPKQRNAQWHRNQLLAVADINAENDVAKRALTYCASARLKHVSSFHGSFAMYVSLVEKGEIEHANQAHESVLFFARQAVTNATEFLHEWEIYKADWVRSNKYRWVKGVKERYEEQMATYEKYKDDDSIPQRNKPKRPKKQMLKDAEAYEPTPPNKYLRPIADWKRDINARKENIAKLEELVANDPPEEMGDHPLPPALSLYIPSDEMGHDEAIKAFPTLVPDVLFETLGVDLQHGELPTKTCSLAKHNCSKLERRRGCDCELCDCIKLVNDGILSAPDWRNFAINTNTNRSYRALKVIAEKLLDIFDHPQVPEMLRRDEYANLRAGLLVGVRTRYRRLCDEKYLPTTWIDQQEWKKCLLNIRKLVAPYTED